MNQSLISKYNVPGPRYTSYPTVPFWEEDHLTSEIWKKTIHSFSFNSNEGISIYIHLPFCEKLCTFCGCNKRITKNHAVEKPYIQALLKEWEIYLSILNETPTIKEIHLGGGTPTFFHPENLDFLITSILTKAKIKGNTIFSFEGHPNNTTTEHLAILYKLGFTRASFGIQDFDPEIQRIINRVQTFDQVKHITELARKIGFSSINYDLVYGLPLQKTEHILYTIKQINKLKPDRIAFYSYAHVPWIKGIGQRKFTENDLPSPDTKRSLYEIGKKELAKIGYKEIGMDHFALESDPLYIASINKSLHRNFMGYSSSSTQVMIGLGVSSIHDFWYGFAQNIKDIDKYYEALNKNKLPIFRGHLLNNEDMIIRRHILNIMCHFETSWDTSDMFCDVLDNVKEKLIELENDGLIHMGEKHIKVTEKGRPFVRNICMAFDAKLMRKQPKTELFSMTI